jgi:DNA-binding response OmpR family regulator
MRILVVDDEINICEICRLELEEEGYEVVVSTTGEEAMNAFSRETPDIVTLDIKMSYDHEGIDLLNRMKDMKPHLPVIMLTAFDFKDDLAVQVADAYITKSFDLTELKDTIKNLL